MSCVLLTAARPACRYLTAPPEFQGKVLNKYGLKTEASGTIKVRCTCLVASTNSSRADAW